VSVVATGRDVLRSVLRAVSWHRRLVAAALAAVGVALALHALEPAPASTTPVLAAARDLPGGKRLEPSDLRVVALPNDAVPAGALRPGDPRAMRTLAAPVRAGEPLTDVRVLGPSLLDAYAGGRELVAATVRLADPGDLAAVQVGDRIDVLAVLTDTTTADTTNTDAAASDTGSAGVQIVARAAPVIALPGSGGSNAAERAANTTSIPADLGAIQAGVADGSSDLVVLAVPPDVAANLARAAVTARLSAIVRGRS
jgi:Flp pilus assembly protein CpaB